MPVTSKEAGNERSGEEHAPMGSGSAYRDEGQQLGALGKIQPPRVGDWSYTL